MAATDQLLPAEPLDAQSDDRLYCTSVRLLTLGGLEVSPTRFGKRQAMLLLAYLALEGPTERSSLAELFWSEAKRPLNNLSSTLTRLRMLEPSVVSGDRYLVNTSIELDVDVMRSFHQDGKLTEALACYQGRFLDGVRLDRLHPELQDWVLDTRSALAGEGRDLALELAYDLDRRGRRPEAEVLAERAWQIAADGILDATFLTDLKPLLSENRALKRQVESAAEELGMSSNRSPSPSPLPAKESEVGNTVPGAVFLGRSEELDQVRRHVAPGHPVAIVGLGGAGKTTLAIEATRIWSGRIDLIHTIDAANCSTVDRLVAAIAQGLTSENDIRDIDELAADIGDQQAFVVLDGVEHLAKHLSVLAPLVTDCPNLLLLLTSRVTVSLPNVTNVLLAGLPTESEDGDVAASVRLFEIWYNRRASRPGVTIPDRASLTEICRLVGGLPLGVILAASWSGALAPNEILDELRHQPTLLQDHRGAPDPHHRDMFNVMATSWQLLSADDRSILDRLCLFSSGFSRTAAEKVGGASLAALRRLADNSLVSRGDDGFLYCHPLVREFGRGRLRTTNLAADEAHTAHAELVEQAFASLPVEMIGSTGLDLPFADPITNMIDAWHHACDSGDLGRIARLVDPFSRLLSRNGLTHEARDGIAVAIDQLDHQLMAEPDGPPTRSHLTMQQAWLELFLGQLDKAAELATSGLASGSVDDHELNVELRRVMAGVARARGDLDGAALHLLKARESADYVPERTMALVDENIAVCLMASGQHEEAKRHYKAVLTWAQEAASHRVVSRVQHSLATACLETQDHHAALEWALLAQDEAERAALIDLLPYITSRLAQIRLALGDAEGAAKVLDAALEQARYASEPWLDVELKLTSARLRLLENDRVASFRQLEQALADAAAGDDLPFVAKGLVLLVEIDELIGRAAAGTNDASNAAVILAAIVAGEGVDGYDQRAAAKLAAERDIDLSAEPIVPLIDLANEGQRRLRLARLNERNH